jgi:hypothetical protein
MDQQAGAADLDLKGGAMGQRQLDKLREKLKEMDASTFRGRMSALNDFISTFWGSGRALPEAKTDNAINQVIGKCTGYPEVQERLCRMLFIATEADERDLRLVAATESAADSARDSATAARWSMIAALVLAVATIVLTVATVIDLIVAYRR